MDRRLRVEDLVGLPAYFVTDIIAITPAGGGNIRLTYGERRNGSVVPTVEFVVPIECYLRGIAQSQGAVERIARGETLEDAGRHRH